MRGMAAAAFDTFQAARALESAGVERAQAEAIHHRQDHASKTDLTSVATELRTEIHELGTELRKDMGELRSDNARFRPEMAALETRVMNRIYVIAAGQAGLVAAFGLFT